MVGAYKCWSGLNSWTNQLVLVLSTKNSYQTGSGIGYFKKLSYQAWYYNWYKAGMTSGPCQAGIGPGHTSLVQCLLPVLIPVFVPGTGLFPEHQQCIPYVVSVPTKTQSKRDKDWMLSWMSCHTHNKASYRRLNHEHGKPSLEVITPQLSSSAPDSGCT